MNKSFRHGQILKIIRSKEIYTQDELARELGQLGIQTTQVTLSRDMRELALVKTPEGYRQLSAETTGRELADVANEYLLDIRVAQNLVVLRTAPGQRQFSGHCGRSRRARRGRRNHCWRRHRFGDYSRHPHGRKFPPAHARADALIVRMVVAMIVDMARTGDHLAAVIGQHARNVLELERRMMDPQTA